MTAIEREDIKRVASLDYAWEKLRGKTVLISGGTGFLGKFLIEVIKYRNSEFNDNIKVISLSRHAEQNDDDVKYLKCDVTESVEVEENVDYILHLASNTHPKQYAADPIGTITTNVFGCNNLLKLAVKKNARFLLASSVEIYGEGDGTAMSESFCGKIDCNTARAGYNESKRVCESLCQSYRAQCGTDVVIARLSRCFGADRKKDSKVLAQFMEKAVAGEDIVLKSKGSQRFSYCYVADAVSGIIKILLSGECGEAYNIAEDYDQTTLSDIAEYIACLSGKKIIYDIAETAGASKASYAVLDCTKLKNLGWMPLYTFKQSLKRTYDALKENKALS